MLRQPAQGPLVGQLLTQGRSLSSASWPFPYILQITRNSLALNQTMEGEENSCLDQFALEPRWYLRHNKAVIYKCDANLTSSLTILDQFSSVFIELFVSEKMCY